MAPSAENVYHSPVSLFSDVNYNSGTGKLEISADKNPAIDNGDILNNVRADEFGIVSVDGEIVDVIAKAEGLVVELV